MINKKVGTKLEIFLQEVDILNRNEPEFVVSAHMKILVAKQIYFVVMKM